ncbi:MAG: glycosyltransferase family 2 protein [Acidobacteriota bacterium]|nr:glycosyltransferase family 2 protein [Acidobacteriota bacterium]MDW3227984.1 glycosyltransferase family 2 protein [Acidobacteriota bacterium]
MPSLSFIIPAYNEAESIVAVVRDIQAHFAAEEIEIIAVDDGSTDQTAAEAENAGSAVVRHPRNLGYGASLKSGISRARGDWVLFMDADGQHRAAEARKLWEAAGPNDMVVGKRLRLIHSPLWRMPGKWLLSWMAGYLVRRRIPDLNSGLRLIKRPLAARYMSLCPKGFSFSTTITLILIQQGCEVAYVPIEVGKRRGKSRVSPATGFETLLLVLRLATLINPLRLFLPLSAGLGLIGVLWGIPYFLAGHGISIGSLLAIVTALLLFAIGLISDQISQMRLEKL